jgi:hypothetical protein
MAVSQEGDRGWLAGAGRQPSSVEGTARRCRRQEVPHIREREPGVGLEPTTCTLQVCCSTR